MLSHDQAHARAASLTQLAQKHNLSAIASYSETLQSQIKSASDAFHSGDVAAMKQATSAMLRTVANAMDVTPNDAPPEVIEAGRDLLKHVGIGLAASN